MKRFLILFFAALTVIGCGQQTDGKRSIAYMPDSVGRINGLQVVIDNDLWNGTVGETIRTYFAALTDGLPQQEPIFSISQMAPENYDSFSRTYRTFLHVSIGEEDSLKLKKNIYATPQTGAFISATTEQGLIDIIEANQQRIIAAFKASEIKERQRRTRIAMLKVDSLQDRFGLTLEIPAAYRIAASSDDFYWIRKDLKSGTTNLLIYEVPLTAISDTANILGDIIKVRDSIGSRYLPVEDDGMFITEEAYAPYLFASQVDGKFAYQSKGTWEVKDEYMAGPFVNFAVHDEANQRYLILEGFTYAPSVEKRDLQFELESILQSAKIQ